MSPLAISVAIFLATIVMLFTGKVSLGLIGLVASIALQITGVLSAATVWGNFTNSSVIMFAALFVLSAGLLKTSLVDFCVQKVAAVKGSERKILWACMAICIVMSVLTSSSAAVAALTPIIMIICQRSGVNARKILKPCCDIGNVWATTLPVGIGASMYLQVNETIAQMGGTAKMGIMDITFMKVPVLIPVTAFYLFFSSKFLPDEPLTNVTSGEGSTSTGKGKQLSPIREKLTYLIFAGTVVCMLASGFMEWSIPTYMFPVLGSILMVVCGILTPTEASRNIPINMILLIGGMLNVAAGLGDTGGADYIGSTMSTLLGGSNNTYLVLAVLFLIPAICTQFMNNIAVGNVFMPLACATCMSIGMDPRLGLAAVSLASTVSLLTPMAAAPQAMIMAPGEYKIVDYFKASIIPFLIYFVALMIWGPFAAKLLWGV